ncbi:hypothetical protein C0993_000810 [Termitomyces sp. T159_Od127]|nr:hypothetical protein C0993_000810 [Termitomyces sp. T159_Od127]
MNLYPHLGASTPFDAPNAHVTSPAVPPLVLATSRLLLALYTLCTLLVSLIWSAVHDHYANDYFSYFTHLTYIGLCAYFFAAGVQTLAYARSLRQSSDSPSYPLQRWPRALQALHVLLQTTITTYPVVVTIVFWALLASPTTFESSETSWSNISMHIFNTVFALAEILLTNIPPSPWLTLPASIVLLACYLAVAYITHADQGLYPYAFLDPTRQKGLLGAYIVGILACYCIVFLIVRSLVVLRIRLFARKQGHGRSLVLAESLTQWEDVEPPKPSAAVAV